MSNTTIASKVFKTEIAITSIRHAIVDHPINTSRLVFSCAGSHAQSQFLILELRSSSGVAGYGEVSCVPIWSGETAAAARVLIDELISPAIMGKVYESPEKLCDALDAILIDNTFLKGAIDSAAWDLLAKENNCSVTQMIAEREPIERIPVRASIGAYPLDRTVSLACEFWELGVRTLKFKTGLDIASDVDRLTAVRDALGDEPTITVDYNAGLTSAKQAIEAIESLAPCNVAIVEQPTPRHRPAMMAEVRRHVDVPILADEGIFNRAQLEEAIELEALDILSIYPGKNGGFTRSRQMAHMAEQAGIACVIGSNLESEIGQAAMGCLAASLTAFPCDRYACDLLSALYYESNPVTELRPLEAGCYLLPQGPGFGIEVRF